MLPEPDRQLLTAFVDGELSSRQRKYVLRLLRRSGEARQLLRELQQDSAELRSLEGHSLNRDLTLPVLRTIAERGLSPRGRQPMKTPAVYPAWAGLVAAASVLLVVGLASYLYFAHALAAQQDKTVAEKEDPSVSQPDPKQPNEPSGVTQGAKNSADSDKVPDQQDPPSKPPTEVVKEPGEKPTEIPPAAKDEPVVTAPGMEMFKPETVNVALPVTVKLRELDQEAVRKKVLGEWKQDTAFRIELPCKNGTHAFERLQAVWKAQGHHLLVDQVAQGRLKKSTWKTNYIVFVENLTPDELLQLMQQLGGEDKKGEAKKPPEAPQFEHLVVTRMSKHDHKELSDLLGVDPVPLPSGAGQGAKVEHVALALAYNPVRPHPNSTEVKKFLDGRKPARTGTLQVLLVLRTPTN
jgi:hypothetical protein